MSEAVSSLKWARDMHHALFNGAPEDALSYGWQELERARARIGQAGSSGVLASHKQPNSRPPRRVVLTDATRQKVECQEIRSRPRPPRPSETRAPGRRFDRRHPLVVDQPPLEALPAQFL